MLTSYSSNRKPKAVNRPLNSLQRNLYYLFTCIKHKVRQHNMLIKTASVMLCNGIVISFTVTYYYFIRFFRLYTYNFFFFFWKGKINSKRHWICMMFCVKNKYYYFYLFKYIAFFFRFDKN